MQTKLVVGVAALVACCLAGAEEYPVRPVKIIVPYAVGGSFDFTARIIAQELTEELGQSIIVENKPGAGGQLGTVAAMRAPADGYTLVIGGAGTHGVAKPLFRDKLPYDPVADFAPISVVASQPNVLIVPSASKAKSMEEFVATAREEPGKLNYASTGAGTTGHLTMELLKMTFGMSIIHVPYPAGARGQNDVIAGAVDAMVEQLAATMPVIRSGRVRPIAVTTARRSPALPDVPTVTEATGVEFDVGSWIGVLAPAGTPKAIIDKLQASIAKTVTRPEIRERFLAQGAEVIASTPQEFSELIESDVRKWDKVIKAANISIN